MELLFMLNRKINPASLENLKMGAISRKQGKVRCNVTILPETKRWLESGGNLSGRIDELVGRWLKGELISKTKLDEAIAQIKRLENELASVKNCDRT
jgi:hypothetical protein